MNQNVKKQADLLAKDIKSDVFLRDDFKIDNYKLFFENDAWEMARQLYQSKLI